MLETILTIIAIVLCVVLIGLGIFETGKVMVLADDCEEIAEPLGVEFRMVADTCELSPDGVTWMSATDYLEVLKEGAE